MITALRALALPIAILACSGSRKPDADDDWETLEAGQMGDSLALSAPDGTQVWFTHSRPAIDSTGVACIERAMEIRTGGRKTLVPLLYTGSIPRLVNDTTIEATLWLHCQPMSLYRVESDHRAPLPGALRCVDSRSSS